jgi:hypothetical protein
MLKRPNWWMLLHRASRKPTQLNLQFQKTDTRRRSSCFTVGLVLNIISRLIRITAR